MIRLKDFEPRMGKVHEGKADDNPQKTLVSRLAVGGKASRAHRRKIQRNQRNNTATGRSFTETLAT